MRIGTRITLTTVTLVLVTLGLYGWLSVRARRAELTAELERQTGLVGAAVQVAFEAALQEGLFEDVSTLLRRWGEVEPGLTMSYIDLLHSEPGRPPPGFQVAQGTGAQGAGEVGAPDGGEAGYLPPPADPSRAERITRLGFEGLPVGDHVLVGGRAVYALEVPIHDAEHRLVGAIEILRNEADVARALAESTRAAVTAVAALSLVLALLVWVSTRGTISRPLERLVEAIDDVTQGDLGRVILRERDDEVGALAERFNLMTGSLRDARAQILAGIDTRVALEERLRHSEKLATIGQLAAEIAHEVGTPLNVIVGRARNLEKKAADPAEVAKNAGIIAEQTQRITKIIQRLLDFARRRASERTAVDLDHVAAGCVEFLEHQLKKAEVEALLGAYERPTMIPGEPAPPSRPVVTGDADQLQQVCLNLCLNAVQAMKGGGRLELATRAIVRRKPGLDLAPPSRYVVLEVADTGPGIPESERERIFEPFYSTKSEAEEGGTGLGLSVSAGIVKDHDGWIEIDDRPGGGTVFRVHLPAAEGV